MDLTDPNFAFWILEGIIKNQPLKKKKDISQNIFTCAQHWEGKITYPFPQSNIQNICTPNFLTDP